MRKVDDGFVSWRKPSVLLFGSSDPFIDSGAPFAFLDSKRTNMKAMSPGAKVGYTLNCALTYATVRDCTSHMARQHAQQLHDDATAAIVHCSASRPDPKEMINKQ